jgi:hypothetical protein
MKIDGLPVKDATRPVYIHILPRDVKDGGIKDPGSCAAARACIRDLKVVAAKVHIGRIYIKRAKHWDRYTTPQALRTEIVSFDRGGGFEAGDYKLSPVAPSMELGVKHTPKRVRYENGPRKRAARHVIVGIRPSARIGVDVKS